MSPFCRSYLHLHCILVSPFVLRAAFKLTVDSLFVSQLSSMRGKSVVDDGPIHCVNRSISPRAPLLRLSTTAIRAIFGGILSHICRVPIVLNFQRGTGMNAFKFGDYQRELKPGSPADRRQHFMNAVTCKSVQSSLPSTFSSSNLQQLAQLAIKHCQHHHVISTSVSSSAIHATMSPEHSITITQLCQTTTSSAKSKYINVSQNTTSPAISKSKRINVS